MIIIHFGLQRTKSLCIFIVCWSDDGGSGGTFFFHSYSVRIQIHWHCRRQRRRWRHRRRQCLLTHSCAVRSWLTHANSCSHFIQNEHTYRTFQISSCFSFRVRRKTTNQKKPFLLAKLKLKLKLNCMQQRISSFKLFFFCSGANVAVCGWFWVRRSEGERADKRVRMSACMSMQWVQCLLWCRQIFSFHYQREIVAVKRAKIGAHFPLLFARQNAAHTHTNTPCWTESEISVECIVFILL